jgi:hypothetical protein
MVKNMGKTDKIIRISAALVIGVLIFAKVLTGAAAVLFGIFSFVFIATSLIGTCPLYIPLKISTRKE